MPRGNIELHTDLLSAWGALNDAEWGRLVKAMLVYRLSGETARLCGNERSLFGGEKLKIDRQLESEERKRQKTMERVTRYRALHSVTERYTPSPSSPPVPSPSPSSPPIPPLLSSPPSPSPVSPVPQKEKHPKGCKKKAPMPPSLEDVAAYCRERENGIDPKEFVDFYTANGWKQGKGKPIVDWKAAVRTWEHNQKKANSRKGFDYDCGSTEGSL